MGPWALGAAALGLYAGYKALGATVGSDFDFRNAWMLNRMTGQTFLGSSFLKTLFNDGLGSMFLGSRTQSAMYGSMGMPLGGSLYGGPMMMGPHMMSPFMMGQLPYSPLGMGAHLWC